MEHTAWIPDVLAGFEQSTLSGLMAADGPAQPVLVRRRCVDPLKQPFTKAVLYIHGYVDYFFQTHLADFYNQHGLHFYALDLRRHGRALRPGHLPNYTADIDEYLQDVDAAVKVIRGEEHIDWLLLNGHSTGGLVAALYAHRGPQRAGVNGLFLNSPFLDMNLPAWQERLLEPLLSAVGAVVPGLRLPADPGLYGESLHITHHGAWRYNTDWKPIYGFPVYAGWLRAIHRAHAEVTQGLAIQCPVLVLHAARSAWLKQWHVDATCTDIVLDVADIARLSPGLGPQVTVQAIPDGIHDLTLSQLEPRQHAFQALLRWLTSVGGVNDKA
ncbi:MAG: alpha/beta hydrolase [Rhodoferax sp.]|uniref:alpha/beta hydrolase n=1 Tax=Rhodoferax sp. TaxID=50421 RepID=UPI0026355CE0|nr:alpha/beta hydrolase [Rhodoferax sp.]MDD2881675.1 alpha/beta hydrolase [Rhodoferax sp.]